MGWEPLEAALGTRFPPELALHHFVVVEVLAAASSEPEASSSSIGSGSSSGSSSSGVAVVAFDFLPQDPLSPLTAAALLSGGSVPGGTCSDQLPVAQRRLLRCWPASAKPGGLLSAPWPTPPCLCLQVSCGGGRWQACRGCGANSRAAAGCLTHMRQQNLSSGDLIPG